MTADKPLKGVRVLVPRDAGAAAIATLHQELLAHPATTCAYAFKLGDATRRAVERLAANEGYRFSALQAGWIGFGIGGAARDGWRPMYDALELDWVDRGSGNESTYRIRPAAAVARLTDRLAGVAHEYF